MPVLAEAEKSSLLWAAGVPNSDVAIITEAANSSSEEPGTSTGGITLQGSQTFVGASAPHLTRSPLTFCTPESASQLPFGL